MTPNENAKIYIRVQDPTRYQYKCHMSVWARLGELRKNIRLNANDGKPLGPEDLTFAGQPLFGDDVRIGDQFFELLAFIVKEDRSPTPFKDTVICVKCSATLAQKAAPVHDVALLFPGQGSQQVGMGKALLDSNVPGVKGVFDTASKVLGYDMLKLCLEGPATKLQETLYSQPAIMTVSLAAVEYMREKHAESIKKVGSVAGFSLGEFTALVFSGALSAEDALRLIQVRAEAMQKCADSGPKGTMVSISGMDENALQTLCKDALKEHKGSVCQVANYLFPGGRVVSCDKNLEDFLVEESLKRGAVQAKALVVGGAFHSPRMADAKQALVKALETVTIKYPYVTVYSNVTGKPYESAAQIRELLPEQLVSGVQWEATMRHLLEPEDGSGRVKPSQFFASGPGGQLKTMLRKMNQEASQDCTVIDVMPTKP